MSAYFRENIFTKNFVKMILLVVYLSKNFLLRKYNFLGTVMSIKEINSKFQKGELWSTMYIDSKKLESTPKEEANDPPKVNTNNNDFNKRKSISNLKFTNAVRRNTKAVIPTKSLEPELPKKEEMLTMQIIPKKGLAKSSSESRYAILRKNISYIIMFLIQNTLIHSGLESN